MATEKHEEITPQLQYCLDRLEDRWDLAFRENGFLKPPKGKRRIQEKKRLLLRCKKLYSHLNNYLYPAHWLHHDAISILLRDYYKV